MTTISYISNNNQVFTPKTGAASIESKVEASFGMLCGFLVFLTKIP